MSEPIVLATAELDAYAEGVLGKFGRIKVAPDIKEATIAGMMDHVVALAVRGAAPITAAVIEKAPDLRVIGRTGVGYDSVDIAAATRRRIPVVYTPGVGSRAIGEAAMGYMLTLCKRFAYWDEQLKAGNWKSRFETQARDLDGRVLGIIGFGRIGQILAEMARPFNMTIIAYDPLVSAERGAGLGVRMVELEDLLTAADFISLHCPLIPETKGLINRQRLALVKPGTYLVNLARGAVVESLDVLHEALISGQLGGIGLDVYEPAPPDVTHPLFKLPNVLTSPHSMGTTEAAMTRIFKSMADDMAAILRGEKPRFVVNEEVLPR